MLRKTFRRISRSPTEQVPDHCVRDIQLFLCISESIRCQGRNWADYAVHHWLPILLRSYPPIEIIFLKLIPIYNHLSQFFWIEFGRISPELALDGLEDGLVIRRELWNNGITT